MRYDVVIIGGGLGGLQCAFILSKEGLNVCLLEKNHQVGGCLQTFRRNNRIFDTGMHYIGSMDEGQILHKIFRYFQLVERLKLKRMDESGYDIIQYKDKEYKFAMGYDRFAQTLTANFPDEHKALQIYTHKLREVIGSIDLFNMNGFSDNQAEYLDFYCTGIDHFINSIVHDETLKFVLLGISPLYAGVKEKTPMYAPLIVHSSYVSSAYRFVDGGSQLSDLLAGSIVENGGTIRRNAEVTDFIFDAGLLKAVEINHSEKIEGKHFISNIHPKSMLQLAPDAPIKPSYKKRILGLEETHGVFTLYLAMKDNAFEYINSNYYVFKTDNVWDGVKYTPDSWPKGYMIHFSPTSKSEKYTNEIIINTYMNWEDVIPWEHTRVGQRGDDYTEFKRQKAEKLLDLVEKDFPGIRNKTMAYYTSTPLTYRDYTGTVKGSIYGILKDFNNPFKTMIMPKTNVANLFLTGQNINVHGVLGVTISSLLTCSEMLGSSYLINKIARA